MLLQSPDCLHLTQNQPCPALIEVGTGVDLELAGLSWLEPVTAELQPQPKRRPGAMPEAY